MSKQEFPLMIGGIYMNNAQAAKILMEEKSLESDDRKIDAFILGINALEKNEKLNKLANLLEKTFDWGCNDTAKVLYANAVYAVISGNKIFEECIDEFKEYILENLGQ